jgi:hypothetical protein
MRPTSLRSRPIGASIVPRRERDVLALDLARTHLPAEGGVGLVAAREHEQAGGVAVEAVDHARALLVGAAAQAEAAQRGHERGADDAGSRVCDDPRRLVRDDHVVVDQRERDLEPGAGLRACRGALGVVLELDQLAPGQPQRLVSALAVDAHGAALDQSLRGGARGQSAVLGEVAVEARARGTVLGDQLAAHGRPSPRSPGSPRTSAKIRSPTPVTMKLSARLKLGSTCT